METNKTVRITWFGHSCFLAESEGYTIMLDPYKDGYVPGLPPMRASANRVLCSHGHGDHGAVEVVTVIPKAASPFRVTEMGTYHDDQNGALRGLNTIHILDNGSVRVAHLGDLGCELTAEQKKELTGLDAVMVPIGGFFTIDAWQAKKLMDEIRPKVIIPMHYRSERFGFDGLGTLEDFTGLYERVVEYPGNALEISADTKPQVAVLQYCPKKS